MACCAPILGATGSTPTAHLWTGPRSSNSSAMLMMPRRSMRAELLAEALALWRGRAYDEFVDVEELRLEGARLTNSGWLPKSAMGWH